MAELAFARGMCRLDELEPGSLFRFNGQFGFKSEYRTPGTGAVEAFCVGSGEFFWGGTDNAIEQNGLMVQPVVIHEKDKEDDQ